MDSWRIEEAEARFGEMLDRCLADGPQMVTRDGAEAAVLVPAADWARAKMHRASPPELKNLRTLKDFLLTDYARMDIPIPDRQRSQGRPIPTFDD